jgi:hypothetical protein
MFTYDYSMEHLKSKVYEKEQLAFKASCKLSGNQEIAKLNLIISMIKENLKCNEKTKQNLLKLKDIKYKEIFSLYQKTWKAHTKLLDQEEELTTSQTEGQSSPKVHSQGYVHNLARKEGPQGTTMTAGKTLKTKWAAPTNIIGRCSPKISLTQKILGEHLPLLTFTWSSLYPTCGRTVTL